MSGLVTSEGFEVEDAAAILGENSDSDDDRRISVVETRLQAFMEQQRAYGEERPLQPLPEIKVPENLPIHLPHAYPCASTFSRLPSPPSLWPQAPVMLRPTPGSHTKIRGLRFSHSKVYQNFGGFCAGCILPINTGQEKPGQSLVIDFETPIFVGTLLMRIKGVSPIQEAEDYANESYFDGKKRRFQAIVKGRFKKDDVCMSECVTGQVFERPAGQLPARFVVNTFIRFVSTLAPQLEATLHGEQPRFTSPLVATAHTVMVKDHLADKVAKVDANSPVNDESLNNYRLYEGSEDMEDNLNEPSADESTSILQVVAGDPRKKLESVAARMKHRKKSFNKIAASNDKDIKFDVDKEYTFEFYQHLLIFTEQDDVKLDMGRALGHAGLANPLNGQPIQFMAAHKEGKDLSWLWSFDIWHQSLYGLAQKALDD